MKTLIFYAKAGGGHESAAKALAEELQKNPKNEVKIVDIFGTSHPFVQWIFNGAYILLTTKIVWFWKLNCFLWSFKKIFLGNFWFAQKISKANNLIQAELQEYKPDLILTTYFSLDLWFRQELAKTNLKTRIYSIVVDVFSPHPAWFSSPLTDHIVFSDKAKKVAIQEKIPANKLIQFKPFFNAKFEKPISLQEKQNFAKKLNLNLDLKTILITGGGAGLPNTLGILENLQEKTKQDLNLLVVAGRNETLKKEIDKFVKNCQNQHLKLYTFGFTSNMYELSCLADLIVSKAGPASVFEALALKKPLILAYYNWPQEVGNLEFVQANNFGLYLPEADKIANKILEFIQKPEELETLKNNLKNTKFESGIKDLALFLQKN
jgi:UDP-N-acetylglucosamine:LPS N-acetylglucosamine transferase